MRCAAGRWLALALVAGACGSEPPAPETPPPPPVAVTRAEDPRPLRVLFVGNSLTFFNDLPAGTGEIAARDAALRYPELYSEVRPGASLALHWAVGTVRSRIESERWDYVVLQDGTTEFYERPESLETVVRAYDEVIRAAGARTVFYMTWSYLGTPPTQDSITHMADRMAGNLGILVAPVGVAWQRALEAQPSLPLYAWDGVHPAPVGTYLGACTMFATLYRRSPVGLAGLVAVGDTNMVVMDSATAALLQNTAWSAVQPYLP